MRVWARYRVAEIAERCVADGEARATGLCFPDGVARRVTLAFAYGQNRPAGERGAWPATIVLEPLAGWLEDLHAILPHLGEGLTITIDADGPC